MICLEFIAMSGQLIFCNIGTGNMNDYYRIMPSKRHFLRCNLENPASNQFFVASLISHLHYYSYNSPQMMYKILDFS
jgi:hypothetical protein